MCRTGLNLAISTFVLQRARANCTLSRNWTSHMGRALERRRFAMERLKRRAARRLLAPLLAMAFASVAAAQAVTGTVLGTVIDTTGAAVPGATVTLTNLGTGLTRTIVTDSAGEYTAPSLPTGKYRLVAELPGFKTVTIPDVELGVDQHLRFNVQLSVGAVAENVTVAASSPLVQITSSELGTTVAEEQIK